MIGVLASGEAPTASQSSDALDRLNRMIKSWNIEGLLVFKITREEFALTASQSSRTMGTGGNFNTTRPNKIIRAGVLDGDYEFPVDILTAEEWSEISDKSTTAQNPSKIYPEGTYPLETINLWPIPTETNSLVLYSRKIINATLALADSLSMPDGYEEALEYNLAVRLAPEYGRQLDPLILNTATELKANLMRQNIKPSYLKSDAAGLVNRKTFNILTGE